MSFGIACFSESFRSSVCSYSWQCAQLNSAGLGAIMKSAVRLKGAFQYCSIFEKHRRCAKRVGLSVSVVVGSVFVAAGLSVR